MPPISKLDVRNPFHKPPISSLITIVLFSLSSAIWTSYTDLSQLDPPSFLRFTSTVEKTESFNKRASFSCSHGEVYPHLSQHLTPGREGVSSKTRGQHLSHCELEPTWTPIVHRGQQETVPGWFLVPRMCELNRSCSLRWLAAWKCLKGTLWVS